MKSMRVAGIKFCEGFHEVFSDRHVRTTQLTIVSVRPRSGLNCANWSPTVCNRTNKQIIGICLVALFVLLAESGWPRVRISCEISKRLFQYAFKMCKYVYQLYGYHSTPRLHLVWVQISTCDVQTYYYNS